MGWCLAAGLAGPLHLGMDGSTMVTTPTSASTTILPPSAANYGSVLLIVQGVLLPTPQTCGVRLLTWTGALKRLVWSCNPTPALSWELPTQGHFFCNPSCVVFHAWLQQSCEGHHGSPCTVACKLRASSFELQASSSSQQHGTITTNPPLQGGRRGVACSRPLCCRCSCWCVRACNDVVVSCCCRHHCLYT